MHKKPFPISASSIYWYKALVLFKLSQKLLIRKGLKLKNNEIDALSEKYSCALGSRSQVEQWEADIVIGKSHKSQILTLTERTSRLRFSISLLRRRRMKHHRRLFMYWRICQRKWLSQLPPTETRNFIYGLKSRKDWKSFFTSQIPGCNGPAWNQWE